MTLPLWTPPFSAFVTAIPAAFLNQINVGVNEGLDGTGGGTYTPISVLQINGAGMLIDPLSAWVRSGGYLNIDNGGTLEEFNGGTVILEGTAFLADGSGGGANGTLYVGYPFLGLGHVIVAASSDITVGPGGALNIAGAAGAGNIATLEVMAHSTLVIDSAAVMSVQSGGSFFTNSGSTTGFSGAMSATDVTALTMNGTLTVPSGSTLSAAAGSTVTLAGTNTLSGATTQTALFTRSGAGAKTVNRFTILTATGTVADPSTQDVWLIEPGSNITLTLAFVPGTPYGIVVRFCMPGLGLSSNTCLLVDSNTARNIGNLNAVGSTSGQILGSTGNAMVAFVDVMAGNNGSHDCWVPVAGFNASM